MPCYILLFDKCSPLHSWKPPRHCCKKKSFLLAKNIFLNFQSRVWNISGTVHSSIHKQGGLVVEHRIIAAMGGSNNWLDLWMWWFFLSSITHFFAPLHFPFLLNLNQSGTEIWKEFLAIFSSTSIFDTVLFWDKLFLISVPAFTSEILKSHFY